MLAIIKKEFRQIFRNRIMLPVIFLVPVIQLLVLVHAATQEMKNIRIVVVDNDLSQTSRQLIAKLDGSSFFVLKGYVSSVQQAENLVKGNKADMILHIPEGMEKTLYRNGIAEVQLLINAINGVVGGITQAYTHAVIMDFNRSLPSVKVNINMVNLPQSIQIQTLYWYNPKLNYKIYMFPGILVILVTIIGMFLAALNLVREKEMGTIEQINVTPIKKHQFIAGKLIPFWMIAMFELAFGLLLGKLLFNVPMLGNLGLIFAIVTVYLILVMGLGLFLSAISNTQQQVMFMAWFILLVFILMSGLFTPTETMPQWAQQMNVINPFTYLMRCMRMILLKGSGFSDIAGDFFSLLIYGIIAFSLAVWRYRKVVK